MAIVREELQVMVEQLGEKLESLVIDTEQNRRDPSWKKKDMLKSDFHHVTMEFKTRLIELVREL